MFEVDDIWQPKTKTEREILQSMKVEREFSELKEIKVAYHNYKQFDQVHGSDLDLELLLEYVRQIVEVFEKKVQKPGGPYIDLSKGIMDECYGFLHQIICMHEAKKTLRRDILDEAKQEVRDRERESKLI